MTVSKMQCVWVLEQSLRILRQKREECERELSVAVGGRKIELKAKLAREIFPEIARCESEYAKYLAESVDEDRISATEAAALIVEAEELCRRSVAELFNKGLDDDAQLLREIAEKLDESGKTAAGRLKDALPALELAATEVDPSVASPLNEIMRAVQMLFRASLKPTDSPIDGQAHTLERIGLPDRNALFTGREEILVALHAGLRLVRRIILKPEMLGAGGIGKTQTAIEYAYRYASDYSVILWTRADSEVALSFGFASLAVELGLPVKAEPWAAGQSGARRTGRRHEALADGKCKLAADFGRGGRPRRGG